MEGMTLHQLKRYGVSQRFLAEASLYPEGEVAVIHRVLRRKSLFVRRAVGVSGQAQPVTSNVDVVFLCMSLNQNFSLNRMERYLSIAWDSGATPVIVLTKADLCEDLAQAVSQVEAISCFSDILALSMFDEDIRDKFGPYFSKGQTCALIGSSGVGKSTLINCLLGTQVISTQEIGKGDKGRHTTTGREMLPCPLGGIKQARRFAKENNQRKQGKFPGGGM